jgi:hypothetical protein
MNTSIAYWFMHHLDDGSLKVESAPSSIQKWLEGLGLPMDLLRFMQGTWPQKDCQIGPVSFVCSKHLPKQLDFQVLLDHKLLPIGDGPGGDRFVIDFSVESYPVGFISHEEFDGKSDPRKFFRPAARSFESFLHRVSEKRFFPCDYFAAGDFNAFLHEEASHQQFPPYAKIEA